MRFTSLTLRWLLLGLALSLGACAFRSIESEDIADLSLSITDELDRSLSPPYRLVFGSIYKIKIAVTTVQGDVIRNPVWEDFLFDSPNQSLVEKGTLLFTSLESFRLRKEGFQLRVSVKNNLYPGKLFTFDPDWSKYRDLLWYGDRGSDGASGSHGEAGADGTLEEPHGQAGRPGGHGQDGRPGGRAPDITIHMAKISEGWLYRVKGGDAASTYLFSPQGGLRFLSRGGSGGRGGDGGHGGAGGAGWSLTQDTGGLIGDGGSGGDGGHGGNGGRGGDGGDITIFYLGGQKDACEASSQGGTAGAGGRAGRGGTGGSGGDGGQAQPPGQDGYDGSNGNPGHPHRPGLPGNVTFVLSTRDALLSSFSPLQVTLLP